jgi:lysophospholipase L1-like esterase
MALRPAMPRAALVALAVTVCAAAPTPQAASSLAGGTGGRAPWKKARVYVQGDSLTVGAERPLKTTLGRKVDSLTIDAEIGRHTDTGLTRLRSDRRAERAQIWVVALGTNDGPSKPTVRGQVRQSLRMAGPGRPVVWMTLRRPGGYERVNTMLRRMDRRLERLHVVDWARRTSSGPRLIASDGVHGTSAGYRVRAQMIAEETLQIAAHLDGSGSGSGRPGS